MRNVSAVGRKSFLAEPETARGEAMKTAKGVTIVTNGQLVDGTGALVVPDASIVIRDGIITYAGPSRNAPETAG